MAENAGKNVGSRASRFFLNNWLSILGLALGVLGIGLSVYFYFLAIAEREPILLFDPARTSIIDSKQFPNTALKVVKESGVPVGGDVTSVRFYFWNNGKLSIKPENVLRPITLSLASPDAEILDFRILKVTRPDIVRPLLKRSEQDPSKSLLMSFDILEAEDGFTCQIIFAGTPTAEFVPSGVVEGVNQIKTNESLISTQFYWKEMPKGFGAIAVLIMLVIGINIFGSFVIKRLDNWIDEAKESPSRLKRWFYRGVISSLILILISFILLVAYTVLVAPLYGAREQAKKNVIELVPPSIKP